MTMNDKIWWIEHQIRSLTQGRGMRPGKAIRRLFSTSDEKTGALARLWNGTDFGVEVSAEEPAWVGAYSEIRSCMQGYGALCFRAYSRHGVSIITTKRDGKYVARALTVGGRYPQAYGEESFALEALLEIVGLEKTPGWFEGAFEPHELPLLRSKGKWIKRVSYSGKIRLPGSVYPAAYVAANPGKFAEVSCPFGSQVWAKKIVSEYSVSMHWEAPVVEFAPYLDGHGRVNL